RRAARWWAPTTARACSNTPPGSSTPAASTATRSPTCARPSTARAIPPAAGRADMHLLNLSGQRFGRLLVQARANNLGRQTAFQCQCDCGNQVVVRSASLRKGETTSCGCFRAEKMALRQRTHGGYGSATYRSWRAMLARCGSPSHEQFADYGG